MPIVRDDSKDPEDAATWSPCTTCPHQEPCWASRWNSGRHPAPPEESTTLSGVHTCYTCGENVFQSYGQWRGDRHIVPIDCPRWDAQFGCAGSCPDCVRQREELKCNHPTYGAQMEAIRELMNTLFKGATDELDLQRKIKGYIKADDPSWIREMLTDKRRLLTAHVLLSAFVYTLLNRNDVIAEWNQFDTA